MVVARKGLPEHWGAPVVDAVSLPVHAAATGDGFTGSRPVNVVVQHDLPSWVPGGAGGLARFFEAPAARPESRGLAARVGDLVVPAAQAELDITTVAVDGFALVSGSMVTLLQLRLRLRVQVAEGEPIKDSGEVKECDVAIDETVQVLFQRANLPEGGSQVTVNPVGCPVSGLLTRVVSISPAEVRLEIDNEGTWETLVLTPGGSLFPVPPGCMDQKMALDGLVEENCDYVDG